MKTSNTEGGMLEDKSSSIMQDAERKSKCACFAFCFKP